ncbi:DUF6249 domain-containing protein [Microbulbifer thermotolerans]|uniref:DUF6249 domain-containing protein n=1 Tax=Microbulbifer thermotolerans TaxID=252514 RepID=UPI0026711681|nr:DUF6249 domain-containing protein [Microbulbifer thermotolerans]WKT61994.1 DUF6249 domain-containing protein [Microbulbifer thermotolerans]
MRARVIYPLRGCARWLLVLVVTLHVATGWAQDTSSADPDVPKPPEPPAAGTPAAGVPAADASEVEKVEKQVRILRDEHGNLTIRTRDENGERSEVRVDLGEEFGGALSRRIIERLESKGVLDEKGLVVEDALESVPKNISIGISGDLEDLHDHRSYSGSMEWLTGVVAILAVFGAPIMIVWLVTRNSYRKKQLLMDNINRMVAEGRDIPPELLDAMEGESPRNMKDRGFTLIAVGLAIFIWLTVAAGPEVGSLGLIPLFIGIARFINWKLDNKQA